MVVKAVKHPTEHIQKYNRILVPIDFSDMSMKALDYGIHLANFLQADVHLIHVIDVPAIGNLTKLYSIPDSVVANASEWNVDLTLSKAMENKEVVGNWKVATLCGDPTEEILKYARTQNCGFILMGTHGSKGFERVFLGSVTTSVTSKIEIPVITFYLQLDL
ncbi:MAG TPA: universal stress protein [Acidobacteriota bacterium]|nr:universal stress protein [Acidobacteriota bacterium]